MFAKPSSPVCAVKMQIIEHWSKSRRPQCSPISLRTGPPPDPGEGASSSGGLFPPPRHPGALQALLPRPQFSGVSGGICSGGEIPHLESGQTVQELAVALTA